MLSNSKQKPVYRVTREEEGHEEEEEDIPLIGQQDSPLQNIDPHEGHRSKAVNFENNPVGHHKCSLFNTSPIS